MDIQPGYILILNSTAFGAIIGASAVFLSQWWTARREEKRRRDEKEEKQLEQRRIIYGDLGKIFIKMMSLQDVDLDHFFEILSKMILVASEPVLEKVLNLSPKIRDLSEKKRVEPENSLNEIIFMMREEIQSPSTKPKP